MSFLFNFLPEDQISQSYMEILIAFDSQGALFWVKVVSDTLYFHHEAKTCDVCAVCAILQSCKDRH